MLERLVIKNIAIIEEISIDIGKGINIITGETGAGKSIIIGAISSLIGGRTTKDIVRRGSDKGIIEGVFLAKNNEIKLAFDKYGIEQQEDNTIILQREIYRSGKNICRINGMLCTVTILKEIGQKLIDIHGQYDNQSLFKVEKHIELLDLFAGDKLKEDKEKYALLYDEYKNTLKRKLELTGDNNERERKIDIYNYQISEINDAHLDIGEDDRLTNEKHILDNSEKIKSSLNETYDLLESNEFDTISLTDKLSQVSQKISSISKIDDKYLKLNEEINDVLYRVEDIVSTIRDYKEGLDFDEERIIELDDRINLINSLKRKYGNTIDEVLNYAQKIEIELDELMSREKILFEIDGKIESLQNELWNIGLKISKYRKHVSKLLEEKVSKELEDLEMIKTNFVVDINSGLKEAKEILGKNGLDKVEFMISVNPGEPIKPLSKIASGGEIARVMLAIKTILAEVDVVDTLIFDEIDTGISGVAAQKVGEKMFCVSKNHQVISVTHLSQIACMANQHYKIEKIIENGNTKTKVEKLNKDESKMEIARIIGGANVTDITIRHVNELKKQAECFKQLH